MKSARGHLTRVSLRTWWLENRLRAVDGKLRRLRFAQKRIRDHEAELQQAKRSGLSALEFEARGSEIQARRDRIAQQITALVGEEQRLKRDLRNVGVSLSSH